MQGQSLLKLKSIIVSIDDLLLDPNNPRFSKHQDELTDIANYGKDEIQQYTIDKMIRDFDVEQLEHSIRAKGFTPVDNIFVKKVDGKYVVIEGNRRISAIKDLLKKHTQARGIKDVLPDEILATLQNIQCMDMSENSDEEIDYILGLRHHGSIKQWGLLPASFNIYNKYLQEQAKEEGGSLFQDEFRYIPQISKKVAQLYSLKESEVREKLQTYRVYLQLKDLIPNAALQDKFSIIGDSIKNKALREEFQFDPSECIFSNNGAEEFIDLVFGELPEKKPVIVGAAAGEGNLRDLAYVLSETGNREEDFVQRILINREDPANIKAEIKTKKAERTLSLTLLLILSEIKKIKIGDIQKGQGGDNEISDGDIELINKIQIELDKIKKIARID